METIKRATIEYEIYTAPSSPLNLRFGMIYAPRHADQFGGSFAGYSCTEVKPGWFVVVGWKTDHTAAIWEGEDMRRAYAELATALGMSHKETKS
jgi:hypothetical protein